MTKQYDLNGYAGLVEQRRSRQSGHLVGLYQAAQAGIEDDPRTPWVTVCEEHSTCVCHRALSDARGVMAQPLEWCEACRAEADADGERAYFDAADETYEPQTGGLVLTLDDLDDRCVETARKWAEKVGAPWPPYLPWAEEFRLSELRHGFVTGSLSDALGI